MLAPLDQLWRRSAAHRWTSAITGCTGGPEVDSEQFHDLRQVVQYLLVRQLRPKRVVETGVQHGRSSHAILRALHENAQGKLLSIDLPTIGLGRPNHDGRFDLAHVDAIGDTGREVPEFLRDRWELGLAASTDEALTMLQAAVAPGVDLFIHDSEHSALWMTEEFETAWPQLSPGGILYADDVDWNGAFRKFARYVGAEAHEFRLAWNGGRIGALVKVG